MFRDRGRNELLMTANCPHCSAAMPAMAMFRLATGTVASCRCRGCSRILALSRYWERAYAMACWLVLAASFALSIMEHSYAPYLTGVLVLVIAVGLVFWRPKLRVLRKPRNWFPVVNVALVGVFACALVCATPL